MIKKVFSYCLLLFLLFISTKVWSQTTLGSVYSIFGVGELQQQSTTQSKAMGFTSIALNTPYWANTVNPAANSSVGGKYYTHIVDIGIYYNNMSFETNNSTETLSDGGLSHLSFWFRLSPKWTGTVGISPYSKMGYNITGNNYTSAQGNTYVVNYAGSGGLTKIYFSQSYEIIKNLSLGLNLSYISGTLKQKENATNIISFKTFSITDKTHLNSLNMDFGLNYEYKRDKYSVNFGFIYDNGTNLTGTSTTKLTDPDNESIFEESETATTNSLPKKIGGGMSFINRQFIFSGDIEFNEWSKAIIDNSNDELNDTWRYSAGIEFTPNRNGTTFLSKMSYRAGYYIENSYINIDENSFNKWGITAGIGVPIKSIGAMNISYNRKKNGTMANDLILETTNEINLSFSIRNSWFAKPKYN